MDDIFAAVAHKIYQGWFKKSRRNITDVLTLSVIEVFSPLTFHEADKLFFLKKSRLKGPMSFVLAAITSIT